MELTLWQILLLAVIQGATEFLPVSSSGHLVIAAAFLTPDGSTEGLEIPDLSIVLHGGTLLSILVFYWQRIWRLLGEDRRVVGLLVAGTIPAVIVGLPVKKFAAETVLANPLLAGCLLPITGAILLVVTLKPPGHAGYEQMEYRTVLLIGISQALAILPGLSRSGTTISAGAWLGLAPNAAATFSFLLAIPAIGGACVLELASVMSGNTVLATPVSHLLLGALVSFLVGLAALNWLIRWVERGRVHYFAWWCIPAGAGVVVWQFFRGA